MKRSRIGPKDYETALQRIRDRQNGKKPQPRFGPRQQPVGRRGKGIKAKPDRALAEWSREVRERDDFTCQMTGTRDVARNVAHHRAPRSRRPDLRLSVENGVTLTPEAHQWVHDHPREATAAGWLSDVTYEAARKEDHSMTAISS